MILAFRIRGAGAGAALEVCRSFGISLKTGYKIFNRHKEQGLEALTDRCRRPVRYANQLAPQLEALIVTVKREKPHWGARKIRELLIRRLDGDIRIPDKSTVHAVLHHLGLVKGMSRPRRRATGTPLSAGAARNDLWCAAQEVKEPFGCRITPSVVQFPLPWPIRRLTVTTTSPDAMSCETCVCLSACRVTIAPRIARWSSLGDDSTRLGAACVRRRGLASRSRRSTPLRSGGYQPPAMMKAMNETATSTRMTSIALRIIVAPVLRSSGAAPRPCR